MSHGKVFVAARQAAVGGDGHADRGQHLPGDEAYGA